MRAFQIEDTFQSPAGIDQRYGQFGKHLQIGIERIINLDHGSCRRSGMSSGSRVRATCAMMLFPSRGSLSIIGRSRCSPVTARVIRNSPFLSSRRKMPYWAFVTSRASCRIEFKGLLQAQSRRDKHSCPAQLVQFFLLASQVALGFQPGAGYDKLPWPPD